MAKLPQQVQVIQNNSIPIDFQHTKVNYTWNQGHQQHNSL